MGAILWTLNNNLSVESADEPQKRLKWAFWGVIRGFWASLGGFRGVFRGAMGAFWEDFEAILVDFGVWGTIICHFNVRTRPQNARNGIFGAKSVHFGQFWGVFEALWATSPGPRAPFLPLIPCNSGIWGRFWGVWGRFWGVFGPNWSVFRPI